MTPTALVALLTAIGATLFYGGRILVRRGLIGSLAERPPLLWIPAVLLVISLFVVGGLGLFYGVRALWDSTAG